MRRLRRGRHRLGEALEFEVADGFDLGEVYDIDVCYVGVCCGTDPHHMRVLASANSSSSSW